MPSIRDAVEESVMDKISFVKYAVLGSLVFYNVHLYQTHSGLFNIVGIVSFVLLFGFFIKCTSNVRNGLAHVLPSFNIISMIWIGLKGTVALAPSIAVNYWLCKLVISKGTEFVSGLGAIEGNYPLVVKFISISIFASIFLTSYMLYTKRFNFFDAYNFDKISKFSMDILVKVFFFIPLLLLANIVFVGSVTYLFWVFFELPNVFCTFFWCVAFVWNLAVAGNYLAQIDYETIEVKEEKDV